MRPLGWRVYDPGRRGNDAFREFIKIAGPDAAVEVIESIRRGRITVDPVDHTTEHGHTRVFRAECPTGMYGGLYATQPHTSLEVRVILIMFVGEEPPSSVVSAAAHRLAHLAAMEQAVKYL